MAQFKRRDFIKSTVLAGVGSSVLQTNNLIAGDKPIGNKTAYKGNSTPKKIIVGGGGIAGLCTAYELMKMGHEVVVMEASGRHGGHVFTRKDGLSDGLYGDGGQEHITKPGYDRYWGYIEEFGLTALPYPRRKNLLRRIDEKFYTEEMLADPTVLKGFGFNSREVKYLSDNPWQELRSLFLKPYMDNFKDEYQPFGIGYDHLDNTPLADIYKKEGASETARRFLGGNSSSALYGLWYNAILHLRGVPVAPSELYRLKGGNQMLPNAFASRLGERVWLNCPIQAIKHGDTGVTVSYQQFNEQKEMTADAFVNCIPLPAFQHIPVEPALPAEKQYIFENVTYDSYQRFVFQASSKFWEDDKLSINMDLGHPDIWGVWHSAEEVDTHRVIVLGTGPGGVSPQRALAGFRSVYPGKGDTIEMALGQDWTKDRHSPTCERLPFPMGELNKFWPEIIKPHGRIYFAGAYADNLNWGTEAATRSANRVAKEIDGL
ncbi:MAG: FAD-dependent oxidoreductase [Cyclobacteriaceae bacterium]|nr:FAD-dependent oxidoreductase [Cyclobacteriaceae bacterium]